MKKSWCEGEQIKLDGSPLMDTTSYVYLDRSTNIMNGMKKELSHGRRAAGAAFVPLKKLPTNIQNQNCVLTFSIQQSSRHPYASKMWARTSATRK